MQSRRPTLPLRLLLAALLGLLLAGAATAAALADRRAALSPQALEQRIAAVEVRKDLDSTTRGRVVEIYRQAIGELQAAKRLQDEAEEIRRKLAGAAAEIRALERSAQALEKRDATPPAAPAAAVPATLEQLEQKEFELRGRADAARQSLAELDRAFEEIAVQPVELRQQQETLRAAFDSAAAVLREAGRRAVSGSLAEAEQALARARQEVRHRQLDLFSQELAYQPFLLQITKLRRNAARITAEAAEVELRQLREQLEQHRRASVDAAREEAGRKRAELDLPAPIREIEAGNAELRAAIAETGLAVNAALAEASARNAELSEIETTLRLAQRRAEITGGGDIGATLVRSLASLPAAEAFAPARAQREAQFGKTTHANVETESRLAGLADPAAAAERLLATLGPLAEDRRAALETQLRQQLAEQRNQLTRLDNLQDDLLRALREAEEAELELLARSAGARDRMVSLLFWIPFAPIGLQTFSDLGGALVWLFSPNRWRGLGETVPASLRHAPAAAAGILLLWAALLAWRGPLKRRLATLAPDAVGRENFAISHTLAALGITVLLALPWGHLAWGLGSLLRGAAASDSFSRAVGSGLTGAGVIILVVHGFIWLLDRRGVAVNHFGWLADKAAAVQASLRRLLFAYVPLAFVAVVASTSEDPGIRDSLGRMALLPALLAISVFWARNLRPDEKFIRRDTAASGGAMSPLLSRAIYWSGIALPLLLALLAAVGYYFAAIALYLLLTQTLLLWLGVVMLYGLVAQWALIQHARLADRADAAAALTQSADGPMPRYRSLEIASMGGQTRQMLHMLIALLFLVGVYQIWHGAVPALEVVGDIEMWRYTDTVDGEKITRPLTLGGLFLALTVIAVTVLAARDIGGLLDAILLRRLELQADANYAIKTVSRYLIAGIGIVAAANLFGISWSSVQWLVAALGVGLGFGLQEIVANFVSGLIVLAERPIRVGDTITVGGVTGSVSRIRARATLITDFDNKEVLIPNKAFITERVVNWTLSSQITRVLIKVGVAYGSDTARAQQVIMDAVRSVPLVMADPAPSVFLVAFGESSLDYEVRLFADGMDKRLPLTHEVNVAIYRALGEAGIEIPFPQRDLHIRSGLPAE